MGEHRTNWHPFPEYFWNGPGGARALAIGSGWRGRHRTGHGSRAPLTPPKSIEGCFAFSLWWFYSDVINCEYFINTFDFVCPKTRGVHRPNQNTCLFSFYSKINQTRVEEDIRRHSNTGAKMHEQKKCMAIHEYFSPWSLWFFWLTFFFKAHLEAGSGAGGGDS